MNKQNSTLRLDGSCAPSAGYFDNISLQGYQWCKSMLNWISPTAVRTFQYQRLNLRSWTRDNFIYRRKPTRQFCFGEPLIEFQSRAFKRLIIQKSFKGNVHSPQLKHLQRCQDITQTENSISLLMQGKSSSMCNQTATTSEQATTMFIKFE